MPEARKHKAEGKIKHLGRIDESRKRYLNLPNKFDAVENSGEDAWEQVRVGAEVFFSVSERPGGCR